MGSEIVKKIEELEKGLAETQVMINEGLSLASEMEGLIGSAFKKELMAQQERLDTKKEMLNTFKRIAGE